MKPFYLLISIITMLGLTYAPGHGQSPAPMPHIGILSTSGDRTPRHEELLRGLTDLGYIHKQTVMITERYSNQDPGVTASNAIDLVKDQVELIVATDPPAIAAAINATSTIPIVMIAGGDVVGRGFVHSVHRPGGNVTGLHSFSRSSRKRLELLREALPGLTHLVVLNGRKRRHTAERYERYAKELQLQLRIVDISVSADLDDAFASITRIAPDGLVTIRSSLTLRHAPEIAEFAVHRRLPSMYRSEDFVIAGGLMSYGLDYMRMFRRGALYVDKILRGENPATMPVEPPQPKFAINLKTAHKIGIDLPPQLLLEADTIVR